jgi:hypothetical protein
MHKQGKLMKKTIILGAIIAILSSNNATAMLLRYIKPTPKQRLIPTKRLIPQQRTICLLPPNAVPNAFNTRINSLSENKVSELLTDLNNRNERLKTLLAAHKKSSQLIEGDVVEQASLVNYRFLGQSVPVAALEKVECRIQKRLEDHFALGSAIKEEADRLHKIERSIKTTIFNAHIDSLPENNVYGLLQDLYDRNQSIARVIETQQNLAINHTFYEVPLNIERLKEAEMTLKNLLKE